MTLWFISDTHFGHANILTFKHEDGTLLRPGFVNVAEMDEFMIHKWNTTVKPADHVYHLGDVAMKKENLQTVKKLNGHKRLIMGNHDIYHVKDYMEVGFEKIMAHRRFADMVFTHFPVHPRSIGGKANVHGHTHSNWTPDPVVGPDREQKVRILPYINVSVEMINYTPVSLGWIEEEVRRLSAD